VSIDSPNILPEDIPHVVVVSHNGFLGEFYDSCTDGTKATAGQLVAMEMLIGKSCYGSRALSSKYYHGSDTGLDISYGMMRKPNIWNIQICEYPSR